MHNITVQVLGQCGSGKSIVASIIQQALKTTMVNAKVILEDDGDTPKELTNQMRKIPMDINITTIQTNRDLYEE